MAEPAGYEEAARAIAANVSPRYVRLEELERWQRGRQYDHLPSWWEDDCPRWERCPCIVYPVVNVAAESNTDLVLGEGRFPEITSRAPGEEAPEPKPEKKPEVGKPTGEFPPPKPKPDPEKVAEDEAADAVDDFVTEYHKLSRFKAHSREAFTTAQATGTAIAIHGHRNGKPFADLIPAKWGNPKFGLDQEVTELEIRYPYLEEVKLPDGTWAVKAKLFRRLITTTEDITFLPADAREDGTEPKWIVDKAKSVTHSLGFCPVVWYPFMRGCAPVNEIDGRAIHADLKDEIHGLDLALSTHQNCMLYSEPQPVEIGVDKRHDPAGENGRVAMVPSTEHGGLPLSEGGTGDTGASTGGYAEGGPKPARKKGPGHVWRYPNPETKVEYLQFPAGLLEEQEKYCDSLLSKIEQALAVVLPKPSQFKFAGAVSGKALSETKSRQYDRCDQYRDDFETNFLLPSVGMQLRITQRVGEALKVPGVEDVLGSLNELVDKDIGWQNPSLTVQWGAYSKPDGEEQAKIVEAVTKLLGAESGRVITRELAIDKLRSSGVIDVESIARLIEQLDEEQAEADEKARQSAKNQLVDSAAIEVDTEKKRAQFAGPKSASA